MYLLADLPGASLAVGAIDIRQQRGKPIATEVPLYMLGPDTLGSSPIRSRHFEAPEEV